MARFCRIILAVILAYFFTDGTLSNDLVQEIDLFKEVGLLDGQFTGVTSTKGQNDKSSAFHFTTKTSHLIAKQKAFDEANKMIHDSHDFWVSAWFKIDQANAKEENAIVSVSSKDGRVKFFQLILKSSSGNSPRDTFLKIEVSFRHKGGLFETYVSDKVYHLDYSIWHKVTVHIQDSQWLIRGFLDDQMRPLLAERLADNTLDSYRAGAELRLAQVYELDSEDVGSITSKFQGELQDVKIHTLRSDCPPLGTCKCSDVVGKKTCVMDGLRYKDGSRWSKSNCTICQCKWGQVICTNTCPVCKDNGKTYLHGETWKSGNDSCLNCRCQQGTSICSPPPCPKPDCTGKSGDLVIPKGQCCKVCKEDQCRGTGKVYKQCGCAWTCDNYMKQDRSCKPCAEGCFCPEGQVLNEQGVCMAIHRCPCIHRGKKYKNNEQVSSKPCQFCFCLAGKVICIPPSC